MPNLFSPEWFDPEAFAAMSGIFFLVVVILAVVLGLAMDEGPR